MAYDDSKYRQGYSIGVGGVVLYQNKVLLIQRALGSNIGAWAIPGGFVERDEGIGSAVVREVQEEAGVTATFEGLMAIRHSVSQRENSAYFIFLLHAENETCQPDNFEVSDARFFTLAEIETLPNLQGLSRLVVTQALKGEALLLTSHPHPHNPREGYVIWA